jgi:uncharacterized protein YkwD
MSLLRPCEELTARDVDAVGAPTARLRSGPSRILVAFAAVVALALAVAACAPPGSPGSGATGDMVQAINDDRGAAGLGGVAWDDQLAGLAQSHAEEIAASGSLWHSDLNGWLASPWMAGWRALGENLFMGGPGTNAFAAEDQWMASGPHRANILNGAFNRVGVGVKVDGAGRVWMVALFGAR